MYIDKSDLVYKNQTTVGPSIAKSHSNRMHAEDISTIGKTSDLIFHRDLQSERLDEIAVPCNVSNLTSVTLIFAQGFLNP